MVFADDQMLLVKSAAVVELQCLIKHTTAFLSEYVITLNNTKSHTVDIFGDGH